VVDDATPFTAVHGWVLAAPLAEIDAHLTLSEYGTVKTSTAWHGTAYHDHNMGRRAMQEDFRTWLWGRVHDGTSGMVYLATPDAAEPFAFAATLDERGITPWMQVHVTAGDRRLTMMGLRAARRVVVEGDGGVVTIAQQRFIDATLRCLSTVQPAMPVSARTCMCSVTVLAGYDLSYERRGYDNDRCYHSYPP
jgi:hypothetical protein